MAAAIRPNGLRRRLRDGHAAFGIFATEFFTPGFCQIAANAGAEFVLFDMEHGGVGIDTLKAQFAFARGTGVAPLVRVPGLAYHLIAPVLDAGAFGIMVPMLETPEQAEKLASWCRYRPEGVRGLGFGAGHDDYTRGDVVAKAKAENERTLVIALVETATGIANVDAIAAVPGIDVVWLGHFDLTDSMGITGQFERPEFDAAVEKLVDAATRHGKAAGFLATSIDMARAWRKKGFRCISYGSDVGLLQGALGEGIAALRAGEG
ncbi:MAG: hpch/hpai aldolase [Rhizobiales bacterium]|nr:hpch/hpai aldolase [Hyphomicrobiales bacterium]